MFINFCELQKIGFSQTFIFTSQAKIYIPRALIFANKAKKII